MRCSVTVSKFYISSNAVFSNCKGIDELIKLRLRETYCLPILCYALLALKLNETHVRTFNLCWNSAYRNIFGFNKWESIKSLIQGLGFSDFKHILMLKKLNFMKGLYLCSNSVIAVGTFFVNSKEISDLLKLLPVEISSSLSEMRTAICKHFEYVCF